MVCGDKMVSVPAQAKLSRSEHGPVQELSVAGDIGDEQVSFLNFHPTLFEE